MVLDIEIDKFVDIFFYLSISVDVFDYYKFHV
jgi:hypothetical protein